jgi:hypothetical protein
MADGKKDNGTDFNDDAFDVDEYADFDDLPEEDIDSLSDAEGGYGDDDFDAENWEDEEQNQQNNNLVTGEKKGLSFNTIVIIGAVIVGAGVMAYTIMSKSAEQSTQQTSVFQSIFGLADVMDRTIFGEEEKPAENQQAAQSQGGFLQDANAIPTTTVTDNNPPQPSPMAPTENAIEPLTPMPGATPRGPEEAPPASETVSQDAGQTPTPIDIAQAENKQVPVVPLDNPAQTNETPAAPAENTGAASSDVTTLTQAEGKEQAPLSAEEILKQAMANREQKKQEPGQDKQAEATVPAADAVSAVPPSAPERSPEEKDSSDKAAVTALEGKLETILERMDRMESDLGSVKTSKSGDYTQMEETIAQLRAEIETLKSQKSAETAKPRKEQVAETDENSVTEDTKPVAAKTSGVKKAKPKASVPKSATGRWEMRAAQPGRAWVSHPGERDMQSVEVGQSLPGIGQITSIDYQNGRWTVYGTQGRIDQ